MCATLPLTPNLKLQALINFNYLQMVPKSRQRCHTCNSCCSWGVKKSKKQTFFWRPGTRCVLLSLFVEVSLSLSRAPKAFSIHIRIEFTRKRTSLLSRRVCRMHKHDKLPQRNHYDCDCDSDCSLCTQERETDRQGGVKMGVCQEGV